MIDKKEFLSLCNISEDDINSSSISWEELEKIAIEYEKLEPVLRSVGKDFIGKYLYDIDRAGIHSYRYRTKDVGHLLEKIIRKKRENPEEYST